MLRPGREVHHRVGAPADRPDQLLDLFGDARTHRRIADIGVDLDEEVAADRHRLEFEMVDVGRDDRAAARDFVAHEFGRHEGGDFGAEAFAVGERRFRPFERLFAREILAMGDIDHFGGDDPGAREFILGDQLAGPARAQDPRGGTMRRQAIGRHIAVVLRLDRPAGDCFEAARRDPALADRRQAGGQIDAGVALGIGTRGVIDADRRLQRVAEDDLAQRHAHVGMRAGRGIDLARSRDRTGRHAQRRGLEFGRLGVFVHGLPSGARAFRRGGLEEARPKSRLFGLRVVPSPA